MTKMLVQWTPHQKNAHFSDAHLLMIFELVLNETYF